MSIAVVRQCVRKACSFRFPVSEDVVSAEKCPKCGALTSIVEHFRADTDTIDRPSISTHHIEAYLDNIRSVFNVGSIFRSADGCGIERIHLGGITPSPVHPHMKKTALGADTSVAWEQHWDGLDAVRSLKEKGVQIVGLEYTNRSTPLFDLKIPIGIPHLLIVGNENYGIDPGILDECNQLVHIPMSGMKESLNVAIAFSIAAYWMTFGSQ
jgi:23S rRNA (guanosine2251-2'-O)-methyltransferase